MKKKMKYGIFVITALTLLGMVTAGVLDVLSGVERTEELSKEVRDTLLQESGLSEINISINLECETDGCPDNCIWSAVQEGIIGSYNNNIDRCSKNCMGEGENETCIYTEYTTEELIDQIQSRIKAKLENYAEAINQRGEKEQQVNGSIVFNEKK